MSRRVLLVVLLVGAVAAAGCPSGDDCTEGWKEVFPRNQLDRPLLSIWGHGQDVILVGGGASSASNPRGLIMHWDGGEWTTVDTAAGETLWWIWGPDDGAGDQWIVGTGGAAYRRNGSMLTPVTTGTTATLFGVWGSSPDDVWIVGGTPGGGSAEPNDLVLHWNGQTLSPDGPPARGAAFFKVWGAGRDDLWVVGEGGLIWHRTAAGWEAQDSGTRDSLTTVHGCGPGEVYAVGGQAIYRYDGARWAAMPGVLPSAVAVGVHCSAEQVLVVGNAGLKLRYEKARDRWVDEGLDMPFYTDYHAAWISPAGDPWAAGGNYNAGGLATRFGMLAFRGCPLPR